LLWQTRISYTCSFVSNLNDLFSINLGTCRIIPLWIRKRHKQLQKNPNNQKTIISTTQTWLENIVIGLNLCPFAHRVHTTLRIGYAVLPYSTEGLLAEMNLGIIEVLDTKVHITTKLIILSEGLESLDDYLDVYYGLEAELEKKGLSEKIQLASFHPAFQFSGVEPDDVQNYTNRSPYPMIHILLVKEVAAAIASHPDIDSVPGTNISTMNKLGLEKVLKLYTIE